jgi:hypothetical protein
MLVGQARAVARQWVIEQAAGLPGFHGAYFAGSVNRLPPDAVLPATSDLDINVVFTGPSSSLQRGKVVYGGVLLDLTPLPLQQLQSPDQILGDYHLAGGLATPSIISDPTGHLTRLQGAVSREFARREWVQRRCRHARQRVLAGLAGLDESDPFHDGVLGWLFPTGVTTHVLLVAGLRNPTVRRRYVAARELLVEYRQAAFHETLLELLGSGGISRTQAEAHLAALTAVFDVTQAVIETPFSFASDLSAIARSLAIDGSRELIERGFQREAMFWIAVTYARCQKVLAADAPAELQQRFDPAYRRLLADLGITSFADLQQRRRQVEAQLDEVWEMAETIMAANPEIEE